MNPLELADVTSGNQWNFIMAWRKCCEVSLSNGCTVNSYGTHMIWASPRLKFDTQLTCFWSESQVQPPWISIRNFSASCPQKWRFESQNAYFLSFRDTWTKCQDGPKWSFKTQDRNFPARPTQDIDRAIGAGTAIIIFQRFWCWCFKKNAPATKNPAETCELVCLERLVLHRLWLRNPMWCIFCGPETPKRPGARRCKQFLTCEQLGLEKCSEPTIVELLELQNRRRATLWHKIWGASMGTWSSAIPVVLEVMFDPAGFQQNKDTRHFAKFLLWRFVGSHNWFVQIFRNNSQYNWKPSFCVSFQNKNFQLSV